MIADILGEINAAEEEADKILAQAKMRVTEIEKAATLEIDEINIKTDAEIIASMKQAAMPVVNTDALTKIKVDEKKMDMAIKFAVNEFMTRFAG